MNNPADIDTPKEIAAPTPGAPGPETQRFIFASEILGKAVVRDDGRRMGRLSDLKVRLTESFPKICAAVVRRGRKKTLALDWSEVASFMGKTIVLKSGAEDRFQPLDVKSEEMLLKEELLDKQVVDTSGAKIERVNDIHLLVINGDLRIVHVDIGRRGILRRLGLLRPVEGLTKWFFEYEFPDVLVSWKYIQPQMPNMRGGLSRRTLICSVILFGLSRSSASTADEKVNRTCWA